MYDQLILQISRSLAQIDRRLARLEVDERVGSMGATAILAALKTVDGTASLLDADLLDGLEGSAYAGTAEVTAGTILAKLLTVDGTASLLDADKLDGLEGSAYAGTAHTHSQYAGTADFVRADGSTPLTANWDIGAPAIIARQFNARIAEGIQFFSYGGTNYLQIDDTYALSSVGPAVIYGTANITSNLTVGSALSVGGSANITGAASVGSLKVGGSALIVPVAGTAAILSAVNVFTGNVSINKASPTLTLGPTSGVGEYVINASDNGTGRGNRFFATRNDNADTPAAGHFLFQNRTGTAYRIWPDASGILRIYAGDPTYANDGAGTIVGTQTSSLDSKDVMKGLLSIEEVLAAVKAGAEAVRRFQYKMPDVETKEKKHAKRPYNGETFEGVVTDYAPRYGVDRDEDHPAGKSLNVVNVIGDLLRTVAWLVEREQARS